MLAQKPCSCATHSALEQHGAEIRIIDAQKQMSDKSNNSTFIVYTIRFQDKEIKRRYSDFDSLRNGLTRLYPDVLVPPIPEKHSLTHSLTDYAHVPTSRNKDNQSIIDKRKRMLQRFLIRLASHPRLCHDHVFHRFLDSGVPWSQVLNSPPLSTLDNEDNNSFLLLPSSTTTHILKNPDPKFAASETIAEKHAEFANSSLDRSQRRLLRRLGDLSTDYAELGVAYNMLGLNEDKHVASGIEKLGLASSTTCSKTQHLVHELEVDFSEHMQEYAQYTQIAKQVLRQRHLKHAQLELIGSTLQSKKTLLRNLLQTEDKALQLEADMNHLPVHRPTLQQNQQQQQQTNNEVEEEEEERKIEDDFDTRSIEDGFAAIDATHIPKDEINDEPSNTYPTNASASAIRASRDRYRKWSSPRKLLNAMSYTIQGMMDVDPEATRRNQIEKLRENVSQLEESQAKARYELKEMSENIQQELDMFQKQRTNELRAMMVAYAKIHIKYCEENVTSWKDARRYVDTIKPEQ